MERFFGNMRERLFRRAGNNRGDQPIANRNEQNMSPSSSHLVQDSSRDFVPDDIMVVVERESTPTENMGMNSTIPGTNVGLTNLTSFVPFEPDISHRHTGLPADSGIHFSDELRNNFNFPIPDISAHRFMISETQYSNSIHREEGFGGARSKGKGALKGPEDANVSGSALSFERQRGPGGTQNSHSGLCSTQQHEGQRGSEETRSSHLRYASTQPNEGQRGSEETQSSHLKYTCTQPHEGQRGSEKRQSPHLRGDDTQEQGRHTGLEDTRTSHLLSDLAHSYQGEKRAGDRHIPQDQSGASHSHCLDSGEYDRQTQSGWEFSRESDNSLGYCVGTGDHLGPTSSDTLNYGNTASFSTGIGPRVTFADSYVDRIPSPKITSTPKPDLHCSPQDYFPAGDSLGLQGLRSLGRSTPYQAPGYIYGNRTAPHTPVGVQSRYMRPNEGSLPYSDQSRPTLGFEMGGPRGDNSAYGRVPRRKEKEPQAFDSRKVNFMDFLTHFEHVAQWNRWDGYEQAQQLAMCLRGNDVHVLSQLSVNQRSDYVQLKQALIQRFSPPGREYAHGSEFRSRRRVGKESLVGYGEALRNLSTLAFPDLSSREVERRSIEQFVEGLGSYEMQKYVQFSHPTTLEEAVSRAIEHESFQNRHGVSSRKPREEELMQSLHNVQSVSQTDTEKGGPVSNMGDELKTLLLEQFENLNKTLLQRNARNSKRGRRDLSQVVCYACGRLGHMSYDCKNKGESEVEEGKGQGN
ncbi:uncharacterized protein LOC117319188 [Pecten maximus]|uniref:uncharacterized protein LOC117319188 n=1 Tax=Pecten maximus TaxID=6579 RepID=UPI0014587878|nr:uncharacterized protein LOC117319188 [Pecten maximus]